MVEEQLTKAKTTLQNHLHRLQLNLELTEGDLEYVYALVVAIETIQTVQNIRKEVLYEEMS